MVHLPRSQWRTGRDRGWAECWGYASCPWRSWGAWWPRRPAGTAWCWGTPRLPAPLGGGTSKPARRRFRSPCPTTPSHCSCQRNKKVHRFLPAVSTSPTTTSMTFSEKVWFRIRGWLGVEKSKIYLSSGVSQAQTRATETWFVIPVVYLVLLTDGTSYKKKADQRRKRWFCNTVNSRQHDIIIRLGKKQTKKPSSCSQMSSVTRNQSFFNEGKQSKFLYRANRGERERVRERETDRHRPVDREIERECV